MYDFLEQPFCDFIHVFNIEISGLLIWGDQLTDW